MAERIPRSQYPFWVKLSIWGVPGRAGLWAFVMLSLACAIALFFYGLRSPLLLVLAPIMACAAVPYWLSIRWIDRHGSWDDVS